MCMEIRTTTDDDECRHCGGDITDHIDGIREGSYGEDADVLFCLADELDEVLHDLETADPPVLERRELAVLRGVRNAYRARLGLDHD